MSKNIYYFFKKHYAIVILFFILAIGIFLRTYHFHDWLIFNLDQIRDASKVEEVLKGDVAWPLLGPHMNHTEFQLGPAYYYFQIISAKIFGLTPDSLAYPDLIFSILTIPLSYIFFRRYFSTNISLAILAIYAVAFFTITYSRFAWNQNLIPFFIILFLLSLHELIVRGEKTKWVWIIIAGISIGIAVQLHAILLVLLPATVFFVFIFLLKRDRAIWKKCVFIVLLATILNFGQIFSETKTNFVNSKLFLSTLDNKNNNIDGGAFTRIGFDFDCHIQSNAVIATAIGNQDDCNFFYTRLISNSKNTGHMKRAGDLAYLAGILFSTIFSISGYILLIYYFRKETNQEKKCFLGLIILYAILSFLTLFPVGEGLRPRYLIHISFLPFLFIGFFFAKLKRFGPEKYFSASLLIIVIFFVAANLIAITAHVQKLSSQSASKVGSEYNNIILGEIESMLDYIISKSDYQKTASISGKATYMGTFFDPLAYIADKKSFSLIRNDSNNGVTTRGPLFFIATAPKNNECSDKIENYVIDECKFFGQIAIYKIK